MRLLECDMIKMQKYDQDEKERRSEVLITRSAGIKIYEAKTLRYIINKAVKRIAGKSNKGYYSARKYLTT